jgi:hypothetical protein
MNTPFNSKQNYFFITASLAVICVLIYNSKTSINNSEILLYTKQSNQTAFFNWYSLNDGVLYLDRHKSGSFYKSTGTLLISVLVRTKKLASLKSKRLQIQVNLFTQTPPSVLFSQSFNTTAFNRDFSTTNTNYVYNTIRLQIPEIKKIMQSGNDLLIITYKLKIGDKESDNLDVNVIHQDRPALFKIARLTKCLFLSDSPRAEDDFKRLLDLTLKFNYDHVFICNFNDPRIHKILQSHTKKVTELYLERVPDFVSTQTNSFFNNFDEIVNVSQQPNAMFDPVSVYLYNLMYPQLIDSFEYVFAGDFDQLIVPKFGQNIYDYLNSSRIALANTSVYLKRQYWYLENRHSRPIIENIDSKLSARKLNNVPIVIQDNRYDRFNFRIRINDQRELEYAKSLTGRLKSGGFDCDELCRVIYISFEHSAIFGQTVHSTRSSELIKLCDRGSAFPGGGIVNVDRPFLAHYRDFFNMDLILRNNELSVSQFHFDENFFKYCS